MSRNVKGLDELSKKLVELGAKVGKKTLSAATRAAVKPVLQEMKARAPVGHGTHKTHKGRKVGAGFLRRSLKARTKFRKGRVEVHLGVLEEAFYGLTFLDKGITVTSRRASKGKRGDTTKQTSGNSGRRATSIRPYTIKGSKFFLFVFLKHQDNMVKTFSDQLRKKIERAAA